MAAEGNGEDEKLREDYKRVAGMLIREIRRNGELQAKRFADHGLSRQWLQRILGMYGTTDPDGGISMRYAVDLIVAWAVGDHETLETWWAAELKAAEARADKLENDG